MNKNILIKVSYFFVLFSASLVQAEVISQNFNTTLTVDSTCSMDGLPDVVDVVPNLNTEVSVPLNFGLKCNFDDVVTLSVDSPQATTAGYFLVDEKGNVLPYSLVIDTVIQTKQKQTVIQPNNTYLVNLVFPKTTMKNAAGKYTGIISFTINY